MFSAPIITKLYVLLLLGLSCLGTIGVKEEKIN